MFNFIKKIFSSSEDLYIKHKQKLNTPWAMFEVVGFESDGKIKVQFNWNAAFIKKLDLLGFTAETEEDTVQLFFYTSQMKPTSLGGEDEQVQPTDLPTLINSGMM